MGKGTLDEGFFLCAQKRLVSDQLGKRVVALRPIPLRALMSVS